MVSQRTASPGWFLHPGGKAGRTWDFADLDDGACSGGGDDCKEEDDIDVNYDDTDDFVGDVDDGDDREDDGDEEEFNLLGDDQLTDLLKAGMGRGLSLKGKPESQ